MKILKKIKLKKEQKLFFVGDLHGRYDQIKRKLKEVNFDPKKDVLVCVGDLIDRGTQSKEVIGLFEELDYFYSVIGNHDDFLINYDTEPKSWFNDLRNGSEATLLSLGSENLKKYKKEILKNMSLILEINKNGKSFGVVHGGIPFDNDKPQDWVKVIRKAKRNKRYRKNLMWDRFVIRHFIKYGEKELPKVKGIDFLIHGHTTLEEPAYFQNRHYIDVKLKDDKFNLFWYNEKSNKIEKCEVLCQEVIQNQ